MQLSESVAARLRHQHKTIDELIDGLNEEKLRLRINPAKWSAFENIVHLAAYQPTFLRRVDSILIDQDEPLFERYVAENDPFFDECRQKPLNKLLYMISSDRAELLRKLEALDGNQLSQRGRHQAYGSIPLYRWCDFFLLHEAHHLWTIFQLTSVLRTR